MLRLSICALLVFATTGAISRADEVVLTNGDHITGKVGTVAGGKMNFTSPVLGELLIEVAKITTYSTDETAVVQMANGETVQGRVNSADAGKINVDGKDIETAQIKQINPPPQKWTGSLVVNGMLARGNTHAESLGVALNAVLRRDNRTQNDRFTLDAGYNYAKQRDDDGENDTTADSWLASGKYDIFFQPKYYGYGILKVEHDRIADLNYRVSPGVGLGYQVVESPTYNMFGEAGISYVYEDYDPGGEDDHIALRLAGHVDRALNNFVTVFGDVEYLPAFEDPGDYNFNADAGVRAKMIGTLFSEFKVEYKRDSTPAPGSDKNDIRYLLGIGWQF